MALHLTQYNVLSGMRPGTRNGTRYGMFSRQHTRLASGSCCGVGGFKRGENHQKCALAVFCQHTLAISRQKAGRICSQLLALDYTSSRAVQASRIDSSGMRSRRQRGTLFASAEATRDSTLENTSSPTCWAARWEPWVAPHPHQFLALRPNPPAQQTVSRD